MTVQDDAEKDSGVDRQVLLRCDVCNQATKPEDIYWNEDRHHWVCRNCDAQDESCGCSD